MMAKYIIKDIFKLTGRGIVLLGRIGEGLIYIGDFIEFEALGEIRKRKIVGIEGVRSADPDARNAGLTVKCNDDREIDELMAWNPEDVVGAVSRD